MISKSQNEEPIQEHQTFTGLLWNGVQNIINREVLNVNRPKQPWID